MRMLWIVAAASVAFAEAAHAESVPAAALEQCVGYCWKRPGPWAYAAQGAAVLLIAGDVAATLRLQRLDGGKRVWEKNPILGGDPSREKIILVGLVLPVVLSTALWFALPGPWRFLVPILIAPVEILAIAEHEAFWQQRQDYMRQHH